MLNPAVSFVRVFSMVLIFITHYLSWKNINCFQMSTVGVSAFLFISGYLYGSKNIENRRKFFIQRVKRVLVPFWILSTFLSIYLLFQNESILALKNFLETLFNLQGIHFIFRVPFKLGTYHISGLSHCWFLTVIIICCLLVVALKNSKIERFVENHIILSLCILIILHISLSFINVTIGEFVIFFVGYFFKRIESKDNLLGSKYTFAIVALSLVAFIARVLLRRYFDDTPIYNGFIASFVSNVCAVCMFVVIYQICNLKSNIACVTTRSSVWVRVDKMTYPIYLTHYMFLKGPFELVCIQNPFFQGITFVAFSLITALVLNSVSKMVSERFL